MKTILTLILFLSSISHAQTAKNVVDRLHVPGPILIGKQSYGLGWSSNPATGFYKQEYVPAGEDVNKFKSMVLLDIILGNGKLQDVVSAKIAELKKMKVTNPLVNYEVFQKNGEYLLDFLLSANSAAGKTVDVVERNIYRYKSFTAKDGQKGILLFGLSVRSYGNDIDDFLRKLKSGKAALLNEVAQYDIPAVSVSK